MGRGHRNDAMPSQVDPEAKVIDREILQTIRTHVSAFNHRLLTSIVFFYIPGPTTLL